MLLIDEIDRADREEVRLALRTALKVRPRDDAAFEELFARLWRAGEEPAPDRPAAPPEPAAGTGARPGLRLVGAPQGSAATAAATAGVEPGYSPAAVLRRKPFDQIAASELQAMELLLARRARPVEEPRLLVLADTSTTRAMAAALPHVDRLLPAHDLESLARLLPLLAS